MAKIIGVSHGHFSSAVMADFEWLLALKVVGFGILCALLSIVFCVLLHKTNEAYGKVFKNAYARIAVGGETFGSNDVERKETPEG